MTASGEPGPVNMSRLPHGSFQCRQCPHLFFMNARDLVLHIVEERAKEASDATA